MSPVSNTTPYIAELSAPQLRSRLDDALAVYVEAMGYPDGTGRQRAPMWTEHTARSGWRGVAALVPGPEADRSQEEMVGIAYGYRGAPHQWWHQQVRQGLRRAGASEPHLHAILDDYFELTELHVSPRSQGHRTGEALLRRLLDDRPEAVVLLSTPEVHREDNRAWRLYRRLGFTDVVRNFTFAGDSRPFAVLGRRLPL
ncbi:GNAT family N-acetyltransferase [Rhodococcus kronopolitis]|uniref:GNAT family N-acetyltransferase n=1 Tax=Rhodococcus kronopolitis TaxID=1460226 RepID=A0ABV9FJH5_9NOCA